MTVDLEAGGALATAGLAAKVIDGHSVPGDGHTGTCANCKAHLVGPYCHACGQVGHVHRSIWHMLEEGLHGVLHFDSKTWRTLPLLIARPGLLTRRYIDGQRVRYVSPLALFLFMIFLMFFVLSFLNKDNVNGSQGSPEERSNARAEMVEALEDAKAEVAKAAQLLAAVQGDGDRTDATQELEAAQAEQRVAAAALSVFDKTTAAIKNPAVTTTLTGEELKALTQIDGVESSDLKSTGVIKHLAENPQLMLYKFKNTAYKFSFMLIPISLPFFWLMFFWKRDVTTYDHMIFSLYSLSFMSMLFVLMVLMGMTALTARFVPYLFWLPPLHMFLQLKETYGLKLSSTLWRTVALLVSAGTVFVLFIVMVAAITAM